MTGLRPRPTRPFPRLAPVSGYTANGRAAERVTTCYSVFDAFFPRLGFFDLTEGIYTGPETSYEQAQVNQQEYLLDQVRCGRGTRLLDVGCGYGTLLDRARHRGARGTGLTLSAEQSVRCKRDGLDARVLNYRAIGPEWDGAFDAVVANGSIEHFVQPSDAAAGRDDDVYRTMFRIVHRVLDPGSPCRFATTVIHFARPPAPIDMIRHPIRSRPGSDAYHFALLARAFGGWYPVPGQLERCASGLFDLVEEVDGTDDYRRTSEEWLARARRQFRTAVGVRTWLAALPILLRHPAQAATMFWCLLVSESWCWQFRDFAPTRLLRQTWARRN